MKKTVLALSAAAVCVASAAPVLAEGQNPMTAPVQISMQGEASMTVANDEAVILFSAESRRPDAVSASNDAAKRGNAAIEALKRFSDKIDVGTTGLSTNPVYTRAKEGEVSEIGVWEARETLRVTVRDVSVVSDVLAAVVGHMNYEGITFRVSDKAERAQRDELLKAAVADALRQAGIVAESIGRKSSDVSGRLGAHRVAQRGRPSLLRGPHDEGRARLGKRCACSDRRHDRGIAHRDGRGPAAPLSRVRLKPLNLRAGRPKGRPAPSFSRNPRTRRLFSLKWAHFPQALSGDRIELANLSASLLRP